MIDEQSFDWVTARLACVPAAVFLRLRLVVEANVETMNAALAKAGAQNNCRMGENGASFDVIRAGNDYKARAVRFALRERVIHVERDGKPFLTATPALNREGQCRLFVNGEELEPWQVARLALEELFFGNPDG